MRAVVVVNPKATTTSALTQRVLLAALASDLDAEAVETTCRGHAVELAQRARRDGVDLVVAVGGDGTVNEVVNGLLTGDGAVPALGIVPGGSANVLARNLGIPPDPVDATGLLLEAVRSGRRRSIGLGRVDGRYFTFAAGFGFDAEVVRAVEARRARGRGASVGLYARCAVGRFVTRGRRGRGNLRVVDDDGLVSDRLAVVICCNCAPWTYAGSVALWACPQADLEAGIDLLGLPNLRLAPTVWRLGQLTSRRGPRGGGAVTRHDRDRMVVEAPEPFAMQLDGDYVGERTRVEVCSARAALRVAV